MDSMWDKKDVDLTFLTSFNYSRVCAMASYNMVTIHLW